MFSRLYFANFRYWTFVGAAALSNLADGFLFLALPWLATLMTKDATAIAAVSAALFLPWTLLSLPAGVWVDRFEHARLIRFCDGLRVLLGLLLVGLAFDYERSGAVWMLASVAFVIGCVEVVRDNAAQTFLPRLVDKSQLEKANGFLMAIENSTGQFFGPMVAGLLMASFIAAPFAAYIVFLALSAALMSMLVGHGVLPQTPKRFTQALREGMKVLTRDKPLLRMALALGAANVFGTMTYAMWALFAQDIHGLQSAEFGVILSLMALGAVGGSLCAPWLETRFGIRLSALGIGFLFIFAEGLIALSTAPWQMGLGLFLIGFSALVWNVQTISWRQRRVAPAVLGRVNSIYRFFGLGLMPLGALAGGVVVSVIEPHFTREVALRCVFAISAFGYVLTTVYVFCAVRFDAPPPGEEQV